MKSTLLRRRASVLALACATIGASACLDLSVPVDVTIRCDPEDDATCPDGTVCQKGLLVCVDKDALDDTPPSIAVELVGAAVASTRTPLALRAIPDEALADPPSATIVLPDDVERPLGLVARLTNEDARDYHFEYEAQGDEPEGEDVVVRVRGVDRVGLVGSAEIAVRFDFTAPAALPTDGPALSDNTRLVVAPAGTDTDDTPVWRFEAPLGVVEEGAVVLLRAEQFDEPFAEANARVDGSARADLPAETTSLWVSQRDAAGNEGPRARVRDVALTLRTVQFDASESALDVALVALDDIGPLQHGRLAPGYPGAEVMGPMTVVRLERPTPLLMNPSMVADPTRGELLLVGGTPLGEDENTAYAWTGAGWAPRAIGVPARNGLGVAHDPRTGDIVLLSGSIGFDAGNGLSDMWRYSGDVFTQVEPYVAVGIDTTSYAMRCMHGAAFFDPARPDTLVVAGCPVSQDAQFATAQWERDAAGAWSIVLVPADPEGDGNPPAFQEQCVAVDVARGTALLFGGRDPTGNALHGDTWQWDGASWTRLHAADANGVAAPTPRSSAHCAWDARSGRTYLFGGWDGSGSGDSTRELWMHDDGGWTRLPDAPLPFVERVAMGVDPRSGDVVVYAGPTYPIAPTASLVFDGAAWRTAPLREGTPGATFESSMVATDDGLVLWGAGDGGSDVWRYDGAWRLIGLRDPLLRRDAQLVNRGGTVLALGGGFGADPSVVGALDLDTLEDPPATLPFSVAAQMPPGKVAWSGHHVAVDPITGVIAVAGGALYAGFNDFLTDTAVWFLDGATWTRGPEVAGPSDDFRSALLAFDENTRSFVLYGNVVDGGERATYLLPFTDVGSLAGAEWLRVPSSAFDPGGAEGGAFVYEETLAAPLLVGGGAGETTDGTTDFAYVFDADRWVTVPLVDVERDGTLPVLMQPAGAFDARSGRTVLFGGSSSFLQSSTRTYGVDALADARPALVVTADPRAVGFDAIEELRAVRIDAEVGASAPGAEGVSVRMWTGARWVEIGTHDAPVAAPTALTVDAPADVRPHAMLNGTLPVAFAARAANGAARARLVLPRMVVALELRMR